MTYMRRRIPPRKTSERIFALHLVLGLANDKCYKNFGTILNFRDIVQMTLVLELNPGKVDLL